MKLLEVKNIKKHYTNGENIVKALDYVSLEIESGEFVAIVGSSGSGKSTLLNMIGGLDKIDSGEVYINDKNIYKLSRDELTIFRRRNIGFIFQSFNLISTLNVYENITLPLQLDGSKVDEEYLDKLLKYLGISEKLYALPSQLSGGQQQRVAIARALITKPSIVLADEPTGNLDTKMSLNVVELLSYLNKEFNQTILMITHDLELANLVDRIVEIRDGKIVVSSHD